MKEKSSIMRSLRESLLQLEFQRINMQEFVLKKTEIERVKIKLRAEIIKLHK